MNRPGLLFKLGTLAFIGLFAAAVAGVAWAFLGSDEIESAADRLPMPSGLTQISQQVTGCGIDNRTPWMTRTYIWSQSPEEGERLLRQHLATHGSLLRDRNGWISFTIVEDGRQYEAEAKVALRPQEMQSFVDEIRQHRRLHGDAPYSLVHLHLNGEQGRC